MTRLAAAAVALGASAVMAAGCSSTKSPAAVPSTVSSSASSTAPAQVSFNGIALDSAADLTAKPKVTARSATAPAALLVKDVVAGTGTAATPSSTVTVQYVGLRYADGKQFDASWDHGGAVSFPLQQAMPAGFRQGIAGASGTQPMKVGGRRIMILPAALGYGRAGTPDGSIPPNAPIAFVVDLVAVK
ncbi:FKBP-type peptidyl-prolyl cis-trans isomerase [Jatrophihabitans sp.]|uniref:FKBP-type peptidyl-prolyl cis-trans isomerase n=1 Tax=Jatrophihabitans sp. TaxID=1932789 RepID=UPI002EE3FE8A